MFAGADSEGRIQRAAKHNQPTPSPKPRDVNVWTYVVVSTAKLSLATLWFYRTSTGLSSTETTIVKLVALRVARGQAPLFEWHREDRRKATIAGG